MPAYCNWGPSSNGCCSRVEARMCRTPPMLQLYEHRALDNPSHEDSEHETYPGAQMAASYVGSAMWWRHSWLFGTLCSGNVLDFLGRDPACDPGREDPGQETFADAPMSASFFWWAMWRNSWLAGCQSDLVLDFLGRNPPCFESDSYFHNNCWMSGFALNNCQPPARIFYSCKIYMVMNSF